MQFALQVCSNGLIFFRIAVACVAKAICYIGTITIKNKHKPAN